MGRGPTCDIIIPVWNLLARTRRCLTSILRHTNAPYRLILIDNASEAPTRNFFLRFKETARYSVELIRNEQNLGNIRAVNQGLQISRGDYVCILDNDTVVFPGWLEKMLDAAESQKEIGIVNPASNSLGFRKPWYLSWSSYAEKLAQKEKGRIVEMATAVGFCMLMKRKVIELIGGWSEDYGMGYYEDRDYSRKAAQAGFLCVCCPEAFVYHEEHTSFRKLWKKKASSVEENRRLFESRFGASERIAYCLRNPRFDTWAELKEQAFQFAQANHWVWIFYPKESCLDGLRKHSNIKAVRLGHFLFLWNCLTQVLKKKKSFTRVYSDDARLLECLKRFGGLRRKKPELVSL